jgi:hypothetical protein
VPDRSGRLSNRGDDLWISKVTQGKKVLTSSAPSPVIRSPSSFAKIA